MRVQRYCFFSEPHHLNAVFFCFLTFFPRFVAFLSVLLHQK